VGQTHRPRIGFVLIDDPESDWERALAFWAGVQDVEPFDDPDGQSMSRSIGTICSVALESQRTGDGTAARVHLDIKTDDVRVEVARVLALAATVLDDRDEYVILQDPGGLVFCVVPV
jgi:hypothetical protein